LLKLTRLNRHPVLVNPDHILWAEASPDTTLCLLCGEKLLVLESLDDLADRVLEFRRLVRMVPSAREMIEGDPPSSIDTIRSLRRNSRAPGRMDGG
jgi:flagellar protein FlbD